MLARLLLIASKIALSVPLTIPVTSETSSLRIRTSYLTAFCSNHNPQGCSLPAYCYQPARISEFVCSLSKMRCILCTTYLPISCSRPTIERVPVKPSFPIHTRWSP
ncbi:hypothetical protein GGS21DRAFT_340589 [Xylaria nigripes]|nr:hypothetical protein GGS21DRAFT_340589 [Xylaria nigripes]